MFPIKRLYVGALLLTLTGCAGPIAKRVATDPRVMTADHLLLQGDYESALRSYQDLVQSSDYPDYFRLKATDAALRAGQGKTAQWLANAIDPDELDPIDRDQLLLLKSRLDLSQGKSREAMSKLATVRQDELAPAQRVHFHTLKASAWNQLGNLLESARESILASRFQRRPEDIQRTYTAIYDTLSKLPPDVLSHRQPPPPDVLGGWMELVRIVGSDNPTKFAPALADWRRKFPGHPADGAFLQSLQQNRAAPVEISPIETAPAPVSPSPSAAVSSSVSSSHIGVLLPLTGTYAEAAAAIRAGLEAAQAADSNPGKLPLQFVDSQSGDITTLYQQQMNDGATAIIGPLTKENVASLVQANPSIPVLALNQTTTQHDQVYQLGLNPEQEVEQIAASAWFDNRRAALILAPSSNFGQRIAKHFTQYWKQIGGTILASEVYPYHGEDFAQPLQNLLGNLGQPPRGGFIYLIADARDAHLIAPQILSRVGMTLPVYATSQVFAGKQSDSANDQTLNSLIFCDVPWLLDRNDADALSAAQMSGTIQNTKEDYIKLIALGADAYRLLPELDMLKQDAQYRYSGLTGTLSLRSGNRFERQMSCAKFQNGSLEIRGTAPIMPAPGSGH